MNWDIDYYMDLAIQQAKLGLINHEVPVGCVFVHKTTKEIIAQAYNITNQTKNATQHCEIVCINKLQRNLQDCILFVTCEPCIMCAQALNFIGIQAVYYGCNNPRFGGNGTVLQLNKYLSSGGHKSEECMHLLQQFYAEGNENLEEQFRHRKKMKLF